MLNEHSFRYPGVQAVLLLVGILSVQPGWSATPESTARPAEPAAEQSAEPNDELKYRIWAAEYLASDGESEAAAQEYLKAAMLSPDPAVSRRATSVAILAEAWPYAAMSADRWTVLEPGSVEARETAARVMFASGDFTAAEHQIQALLDLERAQTWQGWDRVARLFGPVGNPPMTGKLLERLIDANQAAENPWALLALSQQYAKASDFAGAAAAARSALERAPAEADLQIWAARLALNRRDFNAALGFYADARKLRPDDMALTMHYVELLRQVGKVDEAFAVLDSAPDSPEMKFNRVRFSLDTGDRVRAEQAYAEFAAVADPGEELAFSAARAAEALGLSADALGWYQQVKTGERGVISALRQAWLLAELDRLKEARAVLLGLRNATQPSVRLESFITEAHLLAEAGQHQESLAILEEADGQFPDNSRVLYTRALQRVESDDIAGAESDLRRVIEAEPENAAAINALGYTLADRTDRYAEAEQLIRAAFALEPEEASIMDSMGWIAFRLGRLDEAEAHLRAALLRDRNAEIAAHLGEVLWAKGEQDAARQVWSEGLEIDAGNEVLQETMKRLGVSL